MVAYSVSKTRLSISQIVVQQHATTLQAGSQKKNASLLKGELSEYNGVK